MVNRHKKLFPAGFPRHHKREKSGIVITFVIFVVILIVFIVLGRSPGPMEPGSPPAGPFGAAGAALPDWAKSAGTRLQISPAVFSVPDKLATYNADISVKDSYIWGMVYKLNKFDAWEPVKLNCLRYVKTNWCKDSATASIRVSLDDFNPGTNYILAYTCTLKQKTYDCNDGKWLVRPFTLNAPGYEPEPPKGSGVCVDSDGGEVPEVQGDITVSGEKIFTDECQDYTRLLEGYCDNGNFKTKSITCPSKCENGKCTYFSCVESPCRMRGGTCCRAGLGEGAHIAEGRFDDEFLECWESCSKRKLPNLAIQNVFYKTSVKSGHKGFEVVIVNNGEETITEPFIISGTGGGMALDKPLEDAEITPPLEPGNIVRVMIYIKNEYVPKGGIGLNAEFKIDADNQIKEKNEQDNDWRGIIQFDGGVYRY
ncbi:MAG: hypothetical protein KAT43_05830 [Nanoarchaeota archaeon]|nr:hypothetical protein [Nanoarchaeota archaeon]